MSNYSKSQQLHQIDSKELDNSMKIWLGIRTENTL